MTTAADGAGLGGSGRDSLNFSVWLDPVTAAAVRAQAQRRGLSPEQLIAVALARQLGASADGILDLLEMAC